MRPPVSSLIFLVAATAAASTLNITNPIPINGSGAIYTTQIPCDPANEGCLDAYNNGFPTVQAILSFSGTNSVGDSVSLRTPYELGVPAWQAFSPLIDAAINIDGITADWAVLGYSGSLIDSITIYGPDGACSGNFWSTSPPVCSGTVLATAALDGEIFAGPLEDAPSPAPGVVFQQQLLTVVPGPLNTPEPREGAGVMLLLLYGYYVARPIRLS